MLHLHYYCMTKSSKHEKNKVTLWKRKKVKKKRCRGIFQFRGGTLFPKNILFTFSKEKVTMF